MEAIANDVAISAQACTPTTGLFGWPSSLLNKQEHGRTVNGKLSINLELEVSYGSDLPLPQLHHSSTPSS
jgi:hypothetical protein